LRPDRAPVDPRVVTDAFTAARSILDGMFDAAALVDDAGKPSAMNDAFVAVSGENRRKLKKRLDEGATVFDLLGAPPAVRSAFGEARETKRAVRLVEIALGTAEPITAWIALVPLEESVLLVIRDVTAEARMQRHFKELLDESRARAEDLEKKVQARTAELGNLLEEVTRLSRTDPLTGALNRRAFTDAAEHALGLATRHSRVVGVLMCDLDHFKKLNDGYGHAAGDAMLVATAGALHAHVRSTDRVARFGGEEFVVLLTETTREAAALIGDRICTAIRELPYATLVPGKTAPQTTSVGVAIFPDHGADLETLLRRADEALYEAKSGGRDRVVVCR
jgi:diguanylate cyclase (GGDEF)-like protein